MCLVFSIRTDLELNSLIYEGIEEAVKQFMLDIAASKIFDWICVTWDPDNQTGQTVCAPVLTRDIGFYLVGLDESRLEKWT